MEIKTIEVVAYRDHINNMPTCAAHFMRNEICIFLKTRKFGCQEVCGVSDEDIFRDEIDGEAGFLQPSAKCIIWNKGE